MLDKVKVALKGNPNIIGQIKKLIDDVPIQDRVTFGKWEILIPLAIGHALTLEIYEDNVKAWDAHNNELKEYGAINTDPMPKPRPLPHAFYGYSVRCADVDKLEFVKK